MELAAIRVKIGTKPNGQADYPAFGGLPIVQASGMDWAQYVDANGLGWVYDKVGHKEESGDSPHGQQWGMLVVPEEFADQAVAAFPSQCKRFTEVECEEFFDTRQDLEAEIIDEVELEKLERRLRLAEAVSTPVPQINQIKNEIKDALNPAHKRRGVKANPNANWQAAKVAKGITFKEKV